MNNKKIKKEYGKFTLTTFNLEISSDRFKEGIVYTLYSAKLNTLEVGFAENDGVIESKLSNRAMILLDRKKGTKKELILLKNTLNELGIKYSENLNLKFSSSLIRHLSTLGWPVGRSLHKQRKIKKELVCA
tara:strand:+ start:110 stop:502 length:393 start_codon:yes stop_codon:yes gene_type:complete